MIEKNAQIISISEDECIVRLADKNSVEISIPMSELKKSEEYKLGDNLIIQYSGDILETSPARFQNIISVELKEESL